MGLLEYSIQLQQRYEWSTPLHERKQKGQFFTPPEICRFMAGLFSPTFSGHFKLLDAGAGVGSLAAAVCEIFLRIQSPQSVEFHLYENDAAVLPLLRDNMQNCCRTIEPLGHRMQFTVHEKDFILDAAATAFGQPSLFACNDELGQFDAVIMNPPYFKVSKDSVYARVMRDVVHGQPNIYALFLAAGAKMLRPEGELVAITPRSFCNGLYFRGFRRWFFERMALDHIHVFESRTDTFRDVLQESVVTLSHRLGGPSSLLFLKFLYIC